MASWVIETILAAGYAGIVFLMFAENVFPPIPSELIMPLAGYLTSNGRLSLWGIIAAGTAGTVLGALPLYFLGYRVGAERVKEFADRHGRWFALSCRDIERAEAWFARHGAVTVLFCRVIPGLRSLISIPAGIAHMRLPLFLLLTTAGSAVWTALLAGAGYALGRNFRSVEQYLDPVSWVVLGIILALYLWRVLRHEPRRQPTR